MKVREKSKIFEAVQYNGRPLSQEITGIVDGVDSISFQGSFVVIRQRSKMIRVQLGEWIMRGTDGTLFMKSNSDFIRQYEKVIV